MNFLLRFQRMEFTSIQQLDGKQRSMFLCDVSCEKGWRNSLSSTPFSRQRWETGWRESEAQRQPRIEPNAVQIRHSTKIVVMWACVRVVKEAKHCALLLTCDHLIEDDGDGISKKKTSRLLMQARNLAEDFLTLYHLMRQMVFEYLTQHFDIPRPKGFADPSPSPSPMLSLMENRIPRKNDDSLLWPHHCYSDMSRQLEAFVISLTLDRSRFIYIGQRDHWHNRTARRNCDIVKAALEGCQWDISSFASCRDQRLK